MSRPKAYRWGKFGEFFTDLLADRPDFQNVESEGWGHEGMRDRLAWKYEDEEPNPRYVQAIRLYWMTGSYREVGRRMGIDPKTAHDYIHRVLPEGWESPDEFIDACCEVMAEAMNARAKAEEEERRDAAALRFLYAVFGPHSRR